MLNLQPKVYVGTNDDLHLTPVLKQTIMAHTYEAGWEDYRPTLDRELLPRNLWEVGHDLCLDNPEVDCADFMAAL